MVLSTNVIIEGLVSHQYHPFVPQDDKDLSSTPSEQVDTTKTFWELLTGYGVNDQGAEENEFFKLVHFMLHRNNAFQKEGLPLLFVPFIVVEHKLYTDLCKKAGTSSSSSSSSMESWLDYAADDRTFFNAAKSYAMLLGKETVFVFLLFSKPFTRRHAYVCFVRIDEHGSFKPTEENHMDYSHLKPFMMIFDDTGDEHKSTKSVKHIMPWGDDDLDSGNRPKSRHSPKLECDKATGSSCDVQLALDTIHWSTNCCLIYVLTLLLFLLNSPSQEVLNFGTAPYSRFHRWFTDVMAVRVKSITRRYLDVFALLPNSTERLYCVKIDHQKVDISKASVCASQVNKFKAISGKLEVQAVNTKKVKKVTRFVNDEKDHNGQGLYIVGFGEIGMANLKLLNDLSTMDDKEAASSIFWNMLAEMEDCPGKNVIVTEDGKIIEGEGNDKACVELPLEGKFSLAYKKTVDNELFQAAIKAKVTVKIVAYMTSPHSYRVLLPLLDHPLFVLEVDSDQFPPNLIEEFWATLKVPDSMHRHPWTFCPPKVFPQQLMGDFSCMQRSLAALLGHEDALCPVWMSKLDLMMSWRDMGRTERKGATYTDMIKPDRAVWIKKGAVSGVTIKYLLDELSPLKLEQVTKNAREVTTFLSKKFAVTAPGEMPSVGLVCGWPQSSFEGRAKKAKKRGEFDSKEEWDVYSIQQVAGDPTRVHVTWAPSKIRTKEPIKNVEHLITESTKPVFESGAEVVLEDDDLELSAEQAVQKKQRSAEDKKNAKSGEHSREVLSKMKKKDAANYTMHIIPAYFGANLCRDPMVKTKDGETWAAGGTDLQEGIWKVLQKNKDSTKVYQLLQKESTASAPQRFRDPGPRLVTSSTASFSSSSSSSGSGLDDSNFLMAPQRFQDPSPRLVSSSTASSSSSSSSSDDEVAALHTMPLLQDKERDATLPVPVRPAKREPPAKRVRPESDAELRQSRSRK